MNEQETKMQEDRIDAFFGKLRRLDVAERVDNDADWMNFDRRAETKPAITGEEPAAE